MPCYPDPPRQVDFKTLQLPNKANTYLVCPLGYAVIAPHAISPVWDVPVTKLQSAWDQMIQRQPRITVVAADKEHFQFTYIQRTRWFKFPDTINVKLIGLGNTSTIAIYSASKYGKYDFDVNKCRVNSWLKQLEAFLTKSF